MNQRVPARPRLRSYLDHHVDDSGTMTLRGGALSVTLRGRSASELLPNLLPKLDGTRTIADLADELPDYAPDALLGAVQILSEHRLLEDGHDSGTRGFPEPIREQVDYWDSVAGDGPSIQARIGQATVAIVGVGSLGRSVARALAAAGVGKLHLVVPADEDSVCAAAEVSNSLQSEECTVDQRPLPDLSTVALDNELRQVDFAVLCRQSSREPHQLEFNSRAVRLGVSWLNASLGDNQAIIGPMVIARKSPCFACLWSRLQSNSSELINTSGIDRSDDPDHSHNPVAPSYFPELVGTLAAAEIVRFLSGLTRPGTIGAFLTTGPLDLIPSRHPLLKLPRCEVCGLSSYAPQMKVWDLEGIDDDAQRP